LRQPKQQPRLAAGLLWLSHQSGLSPLIGGLPLTAGILLLLARLVTATLLLARLLAGIRILVAHSGSPLLNEATG